MMSKIGNRKYIIQFKKVKKEILES